MILLIKKICELKKIPREESKYEAIITFFSTEPSFHVEKVK